MKQSEVDEMEWSNRQPTAVSYQPTRQGRLVSYSLPCPGLAAMDFLAQVRGTERFYWQDGRQEIAFAASGVATELMAWGENRFASIQEQARQLFRDTIVLEQTEPLAAPRLFGGFAFRDDFTPDNTWSVFHPAHFILPHYQLTQIGEKAWLTINTQLPENEDLHEVKQQLHDALSVRHELLHQGKANQFSINGSSSVSPWKSHHINYPMPYDRWEKMIQHAVASIKSSELEKVVLARVCEIRLAERLNVGDALCYLNQHYADCYRFLFEPRPYHTFYGATPELLARVQGYQLETAGLAGSIGRGKSLAEDQVLATELLHSSKDQHEHALVVQAIQRRLQPLTSELEVPPQPTILSLSNIQHLYTPIQGRLHQASGILPIIEVLHPTPALGGSPRGLAMNFIRQAEPVPRGWYAAPIGWIDYQLDGCFGVAIRSAVSQEERVWLYAGCGIVADSQPHKEWDETTLKFRPMLDASLVS